MSPTRIRISDCTLRDARYAPGVFLSGRNDKSLSTTPALAAAASMVMNRFVMCSFLKESGDSGTPFELGSSAMETVFDQCTFHADNGENCWGSFT